MSQFSYSVVEGLIIKKQQSASTLNTDTNIHTLSRCKWPVRTLLEMYTPLPQSRAWLGLNLWLTWHFKQARQDKACYTLRWNFPLGGGVSCTEFHSRIPTSGTKLKPHGWCLPYFYQNFHWDERFHVAVAAIHGKSRRSLVLKPGQGETGVSTSGNKSQKKSPSPNV